MDFEPRIILSFHSKIIFFYMDLELHPDLSGLTHSASRFNDMNINQALPAGMQAVTVYGANRCIHDTL